MPMIVDTSALIIDQCWWNAEAVGEMPITLNYTWWRCFCEKYCREVACVQCFIFTCAIICLSLPCISVITSVLMIPKIVCHHFHSLEQAPLIALPRFCSYLMFVFLLEVLVFTYTYHPSSNLAHLVLSNCRSWHLSIYSFMLVLCNNALKIMFCFVY